MTVLGFRQKTYCAKSFRVHASGLEIILSGTLDGMIDMAIIESHGKSLTYSIEPTEARQLADKLCAAASDVTQYCLYDNDTLLRG